MKVTLIIYEIGWMPNLIILEMPDFKMLFLKLPNHFLHFNWLLGKTMPKLLVTYG